MQKRVIVLLLMLLVTACSPAPQEESAALLPTIASLPSPTPPAFTLDAAERVTRSYLEAWKNSDFATMHSLIAFASREAMPLADFTALYQSSHTIMTLESLDYVISSQMTDNNSTMMVFSYDVTFQTDIVGAFTDPNRTLRLVFDSTATEWRVAWSQADVFAAMGTGGRLRLEPRIPSRANIYDSEGNILADQNARVVNVSIVKRDIVAYETCVGSLAQALDKPVDELQTLLDQRGLDQLSDMGTIEASTYVAMHEQLERECGARFRDQPARRYANGTLLPHILGNVGYPEEAEIPAVQAAGFNQDSILGRSGIEKSWDETLRGRPGGRLMIVSPNNEITILAEGASRPSESVWLTIDTGLQTFVTDLLNSAYQSAAGGWANTSRGASAVVIDVNTGAILAMVSYPTYDNNAFNPFSSLGREAANLQVAAVQNDNRVPLLNRPALGTYPVGSTFKVVPAIAAADSGVYELDERYACSGIWNRDIPRYDWLAGGHGTLTLAGSLTNSCNPYYYETGYRLNEVDPYLLPNYARRLGLGSVTGLRDIAEASGTIIDPDWLQQRGGAWRFSDAVNMAIGQGEVEATPLQISRLFALIANGGDLYRPQLVQKAGILGEMPSYEMRPEILSNANIKPEVLEVVRQGLCDVTSTNAGTAEFQFRGSPLQSIRVCGKTGTAQATGAGSLPHAWFAGYGPQDDPEIAVVVMVENAGEGSAVAAPLVRDIMEYYFFGEDFIQ